MRLSKPLIVCSVLFLHVTGAYADDEKDKKDTVDAFEQNFGISAIAPPTNLAGNALSIGNNDIQKIASGSALLGAITPTISPAGKLQWTGAVEFTPFALGANVDQSAYQNEPFQRLIANSRISFAMSQAETEVGDGSIALGVQTVLFDRGDLYKRGWVADAAASPPTFEAGSAPLLKTAVGKCLNSRVISANEKKRNVPAPPDDTSQDVPTQDSPFRDEFSDCAKIARKSTWNDASLGVGLVEVARATGNEITDLSESNTVAYVTASYGFEGLSTNDKLIFKDNMLRSQCDNHWSLSCNAQIIFQLKYQSDGVYEIPEMEQRTGESLGFGAKFVAGSERSVVYAYYAQENVEIGVSEFDVHEYGIGFETKFLGDRWLNLSVSRSDNDLMAQDDTTAKASFSFTFEEASKLINPFSG